MNYFPRFLSGLIEIDDAWLRSPVISGKLMPFGTVMIGSEEMPFHSAYVSELYNRFGQMLINDAISSSVIDLSINEGTLSGNLRFNQTLQIDGAGNLGVTQQIVSPAGIEYTYIDPLFCEPDPLDNSKARVILKYDEDSFNLTDEGKLKTVDLNITSGGAIRVRRADWTLGETDSRLRVISIDVSSDFQQTGGILAIRSDYPGRIPFYQVGSGFSNHAGFSYDGASTLSVQFVKLTESFTLPDNYAAPIGYVMQAYQAGVNTGLDISAAANGRRIISARTDPSSILIDQNNNLSVKLDPSGALKKDIQLGLDVKTDATGVIFKDASANNALDARCDGSSIQKVAGSLSVNLQEFGGLKVTAAGVGISVDGVTVMIGTDGILNGGYRAMFPLRLPTGTSELSLEFNELTLKTDATGLTLNLSETSRGLESLADGVSVRTQAGDVIGCDYGGLYLQISPDDSCLAKTATGLEVTVAPDGPLRKELLGLDIAVDGVTIKKTLAGLVCGLRGDVDGDITVTPAGLILCNISAGQGLQKLGTVISALPNTELEDKVDQAKNAADAAADTANQAVQTADDLADRLGDLSSVMESLGGDLAKQIGIAVGTSALTSMVTTAVSAAALGLAAQSAAQNIISSNVAGAVAAGGIFSGLFGAIGGAIAGALGKKANQNTYISYNSFSNGSLKEKETDNEEDVYYYGFSICCGTDYSIDLFPDRALAPCVVTPLLGSDLLPVESSHSRSGQLCVEGGLGVSGNIHAGKEVFANGKRLSTEEFVMSQGFITGSAAGTQFQPLLTVESPLSMSYDRMHLGINLFNYSTTQQTDAAIATAVLGLATESFVTAQGYITSSALTGLATETYVNDRGFITSAALTGLATESFVTSKGYITSAALTSTLGSYVTNSSLTSTLGSYALNSALTSGLATRAPTFSVNGPLAYANNVISVDAYSRSQVDSLLSNKQGTGDFATNSYVNSQLSLKQNTINWGALPDITANSVISNGNMVCNSYLYHHGGGGSDGTGTTGGVAFEYSTGGYRHWMVSRHHGGQQAGNAIDFYIGSTGGQWVSSAPGVNNVRRFAIDASVVAVEGVPLRATNGIDLTGAHLNISNGSIYIPNNGNGIVWGNTVSKIYDDAQLHIYTDDNLYVDFSGQAGALSMNTSGANFLGVVKTSNGTANLGCNPYQSGAYMRWNYSGGNGEVNFMCQRANAVGGFNWLQFNNSNVLERTLMSLDANGNLTIPGDLFSGGKQLTSNGGSIIRLSPAVANGLTEIGFANLVDYNAVQTYFKMGRGSWSVGVDTFALGADSAGYIQSWDRWGASKIQRGLTVGTILTMDNGGLGAPSFTSRSSGTRIVLWAGVGASSVDYAMGMNGDTFWSSIPTTNAITSFKWYAGTTNVATLNGQGLLTLRGGVGGLDAYSATVSGALTAGTVNTIAIQGGSNYVALRCNYGSYTNYGVFTANAQGLWADIPFTVNSDNLGDNPIYFYWNDLAQSSGGGFRVNTASIFRAPILLTGQRSVSVNSEFRYFSVAGSNWVGYNTANYSMVVGGGSRILLCYNSEINIQCDDKLKTDVVEIIPEKALRIIAKQRSIGFKYKIKETDPKSDYKPQKYGFSAQELLGHEYLRDLVTSYKSDETSETLVLDSNGIVPILWAGIRALIARVEKLEGGK